MKQLILLVCFAIFIISCQKEANDLSYSQDYLRSVKLILKDSLSASDYNTLDFSKIVESKFKIKEEDVHLLRIPFVNRNPGDFVLLRMDNLGKILKGKIIHMVKEDKLVDTYNGSILISSFKRDVVLTHSIINGYMQLSLMHKTSFQSKGQVESDPYVELPVVVVVGTYSSGGISFSTWVSLISLIGDAYGGGGGGYYNNYDPWLGVGGGGGGGGNGSGSGGNTGGNNNFPIADNTMLVDFELGIDNPGIDIEKYLKCFDNVPDVGSECSIEIFSDIPVDSDPTKLFDWKTESPGHAFLQLSKGNGANSVIQNIGFYPTTNWKSILTTAPIDGKIVDNGGHELNASFKMNVSAANFKSILTHILYLSRFIKYDIDDYNCTDFALDVFNYVRTDKLEIPKYDLPNGESPYGSSTPQGLYQKLQQMKNASHPEAGNITIGIYKGWVASSKGPCN